MKIDKVKIDLSWGQRYDDLLIEASSMIIDHWNEVGSFREHFSLDPDHDNYRRMENAGILNILTARSGSMLVGYLFILVTQYPRNKRVRYAVDDSFYVRPGYRRYGVGRMMLEEALAKIEQAQINIVAFRHKAWRRGKRSYLERYGLEPQETVYAKVLKGINDDRLDD